MLFKIKLVDMPFHQCFQFPKASFKFCTRKAFVELCMLLEGVNEHCDKPTYSMFTPHQEDTNSSTKCLWFLHFEYYLTFDHIF